nr:MAG TPA: hypothetical protein [Caudoviricetes sp.]
MLNISYLVLHADLRKESAKQGRLDESLVLLVEIAINEHGLHPIATQLHTSNPRVAVEDRLVPFGNESLEFKEDLDIILRNVDRRRRCTPVEKLHGQTRLSFAPDDPTILEIDPNGVGLVICNGITDRPLSDSQDTRVDDLLGARISVELSSRGLEICLHVIRNLCHQSCSVPGSFLSAFLIEIRDVLVIFGLNSALLAHHEPYLAPLPNPGVSPSPRVVTHMIQSSPASITVSLVLSSARRPLTKNTILRTYQTYSVVTGSLLPLTVLLTCSPMTMPSI